MAATAPASVALPGGKRARTVPCAYKTGRTLGSGTYAVVKEAQRISDGQRYACKIISKKLLEGRESMVRNEIMAMKKVSQGHPNAVTLIDYFETLNNLYVVTELCTGGELFDRICERGSYFEKDAAHIIRTVTAAVGYLHDNGVIHRDLKPENLLFKSKDESSDLVIADFGLSRIVDDDKMVMLNTTCGTPGYMAPELFNKTGHWKPVDMWAVGVIAYFLLCGYTPFDRESMMDEVQAIVTANYAFEPAVYWTRVSESAKDFIRRLLVIDQQERMTAAQALQHPWLTGEGEVQARALDQNEGHPDLLPGMKRAFSGKATLRKAVNSIRLINRLQSEVHKDEPDPVRPAEVEEIRRTMEATEKEDGPAEMLVDEE